MKKVICTLAKISSVFSQEKTYCCYSIFVSVSHIISENTAMAKRQFSAQQFFSAETERPLLTLYILESFEIFYSEEWLRQFTDEEF